MRRVIARIEAWWSRWRNWRGTGGAFHIGGEVGDEGAGGVAFDSLLRT
jgi:hypothetical protein